MNVLRRHRLALLSLALVAAAPAAAQTFEQRCESEMRPVIEVQTRQVGVVVNNGVSSRVLNTRSTYARSGNALLGMTASRTRADTFVGGPALVDRANGRECVAPRIMVELSYQPMDVFIAREFHPASCSYREVFAHEMLHVALYAETLPRIEQRVREELQRRYGGRPLYAPLDTGVATLHEQIGSWLPALLRAELATVEQQQRALDSPDENERLSHLCQGEITYLMGSSF